MDKRYEVIAECKCGKQQIDICELINKYGYIEFIKWLCPNCWSVVTMTVYANEEIQDRWCKDCRLKIESAKNMDCVSICETCAVKNL